MRGQYDHLRSRVRIGVTLAIITAAGPLLAPASARADLAADRALRRTPVVDVFEKTRDSVVNIAAIQVVELSQDSSWLENFFDVPAPMRRPRRYQQTHLGSGFIIHEDGYVVTNAHVAARAAKVKIIFADGAEHEASPVAIDKTHDLAILKIKAPGPFPAITLGRSDDLMIGETAIAIGNPLGYEHTVTAGIISATNRKLKAGKNFIYEGLIQTDTSINPGNSGGPLLNILGQLIGINTAIRGDAQNIGFAIPVDALRKILPEMLSIKQRKRLEIGLRLTWRGAVHVVEATGPAARAGIRAGDHIIRADNKPIHQDIDFYIHLLGIDRNDRLALTVERDGKPITFNVRPEPIPVPDGGRLLREKFGFHVRILSEDQARRLDVDGRLLITQVDRGSPADQAGFVPGLIIFQIGQHFPTDLEDVGLLLENIRRGDPVAFKVYEVQQMFLRVLAATLTAR